jgi:uncharacterized membrane protein YeaQ/YmgE (transglycosylase-associated protein family)
MNILLVLVFTVIVGVIVGAVAGPIWKGDRPIGVAGDYVAAVVAAVATGLLDYYVIPAMGFSQTMVYLGIAIEPALMALIVLWLVRKAKQ